VILQVKKTFFLFKDGEKSQLRVMVYLRVNTNLHGFLGSSRQRQLACSGDTHFS